MIQRAGTTACLSALMLLTGCGKYADFRLPSPQESSQPVRLTWRPQAQPILTRGPGSADAKDALNPSIVKRNGQYYNFYSGYDGATWRTLLATSPDGGRWQKQGVVLAPDRATWEGSYIAANGTAMVTGDQFLYWYVAGPKETPRLGLAKSADGRNWTKLPRPVLETGPRGSWDERGVADPYIIRTAGYFYLFYLGQDRARRQRLGVARSIDGEHWEKLRTNPVLELGSDFSFDENGLGEPAVWQGQGWYWMLYTGRHRSERRSLGVARSRDGVHWEKRNEIFAGTESWDSAVVCDPTVELSGSTVRVWFGGGDTARPDENVNGQIGIAALGVTLAK